MDPDPDLHLMGLSIWIIGWQFPEATNFWDASWLHVRAEMRDSGAVVVCEGHLFRREDLARFRDELSEAHQLTSGLCTLSSLEPNLSLRLKVGETGQVSARVEITPDHMFQQHIFDIGLDQSYFPALIDACDRILENYPVR